MAVWSYVAFQLPKINLKVMDPNCQWHIPLLSSPSSLKRGRATMEWPRDARSAAVAGERSLELGAEKLTAAAGERGDVGAPATRMELQSPSYLAMHLGWRQWSTWCHRWWGRCSSPPSGMVAEMAAIFSVWGVGGIWSFGWRTEGEKEALRSCL